MSFSAIEVKEAIAQSVSLTSQALIVDLNDGRTITVPRGWFPRLGHGTQDECANWRLIGNGVGIHWPELDEDISVASLLAGRKSAESPASVGRWFGP